MWHQASYEALARVDRQRMSTWLACMLHRIHWWWKVCLVCPVTVCGNRISGRTGRVLFCACCECLLLVCIGEMFEMAYVHAYYYQGGVH